MDRNRLINHTDKSKIKEQEVKTPIASITHSESSTLFDMTDSARKSLDNFKGDEEHKKVLILEEMINKVFPSISDNTIKNDTKNKFKLLRDSIIHNDKISENALWDILRRESSQILVQEGLRNIKDLCKASETTQQNLDQFSSDHIISSKEHLYALVDTLITSKKLDGKRFSSKRFLQDIGVTTSDQEKAQVIILERDQNIWKKYLDAIKDIDSDVRIRTYTALKALEKRQVESRR